jgi:diguanylate cyclase (GGDEF)-like protein
MGSSLAESFWLETHGDQGMENQLLLDVAIAAVAAGATVLVLTLGRSARVRKAIRAWSASRVKLPGNPLVDPISGLASRQAWNDALRREEDRLARYRRPATILVAELDGLERFAAAFGQDVASCLIPPVAAVISRNARNADIVASIEYGRFVALLPETSEIAATNYVERVRAESDAWLEACAVTIRVAVGWAQPIGAESLADALRLAIDRMNSDRRRRDFRGSAEVSGNGRSNLSFPPAAAVPPAAPAAAPGSHGGGH